MISSELKRLQKIEKRVYEIARENGLIFCDIEFDIVPKEKMFEIMAYGTPGQISNWKYGRDYEKTRTIYEKMGEGLPYEVVVHTDPSRAYLMRDNTIAVQTLLLAHVVGHVAFFTMNQNYVEADSDIASRLSIASQRFEEYERTYGIDIVEKTIDAGHSIMLHSNPWLKEETEDDKLKRIFDQMKKRKHDRLNTEYSDMFETDTPVHIDREKWNQNLYMNLKNKTPIEPTEDILRYIIDNSRSLSDWQKDILEIVRSMGKYYWPMIKTKYMNEGFATYWHEVILRQLFREKLLDDNEHAESNYCNSLVKAKNPFSLNPYLIGCELWEDIVKRWDKGQHGDAWNQINDHEVKMKFDNKDMKGREKMFKVMRTSNDWMFMNNFLTNDLVKKLKLYLYMKKGNSFFEELVITDKKMDELRDIIIKSFSHSGIPKVFIEDGNYEDKGELLAKHEHIGVDLDVEYAQKTLDHIAFLWGDKVTLKTIRAKIKFSYTSKNRSISYHGDIENLLA